MILLKIHVCNTAKLFERSGAVFGAPGATGRGHLAVGGGGGAGGGGRQDPPDYRPEVNQQIAQALTQLQQDMTSVLSRLNTLEALTVAQTQVRSKRFDEALRTCILFCKCICKTIFFLKTAVIRVNR